MALKLMYLTNDPEVARIAQNAGVDRIVVDLEKLGKAERQGQLDSVISDHQIEDIDRLRPLLGRSELLVRVNPLHDGSRDEINAVLSRGADLVMLPMFQSAADAVQFVRLVSGRARTVLLLETAEAEENIGGILEVPGIDEIHIGLNDLHLARHRKFLFELLADGTVETLCGKIAAKGIPYGFGGVSRIGGGILPAGRILAEHYRLGSSAVILSRSFCNAGKIADYSRLEDMFMTGVAEIRQFEAFLSHQSEAYFSDNMTAVRRIVRRIAESA